MGTGLVKKLSENVENGILEDLKKGLKKPEIAKKWGVVLSTVYLVQKRNQGDSGPLASGSDCKLSDLRADARRETVQTMKSVAPIIAKAVKNAAKAAVSNPELLKQVDQGMRAYGAAEKASVSAASEPKVPKGGTAIQIVVAPGWSKAGPNAGMATVQAPPAGHGGQACRPA